MHQVVHEWERSGEVLATAIRVFAAHGVEAARLPEIARHAGVSVSSLQREFGTKDDLFRVAVRAVAHRHVTRACAELPPGSAVEQLRNFCGRGWEILHTPAYAALYRLWVAEVPRYPDLARFYAEEVYGAIHQMLTGIIERGVAEGTFRPAVAHAAARLIQAALVKQAFWCNHVDAFGPQLGSGCSRVVAETLSIVLGGLRLSPPDSTS